MVIKLSAIRSLPASRFPLPASCSPLLESRIPNPDSIPIPRR
jgi:hypothetical protein